MQMYGAQGAAVWENNVYDKSLILHAVASETRQRVSFAVIQRDSSLTGLAIRKCDTVVHEDVSQLAGDEAVSSREILTNFPVGRMVSIPIPSMYDPQLITLVVSLYFDKTRQPSSRLSSTETAWLVDAVGFAFEFVLNELEAEIRRCCENTLPEAGGISGILDRIQPEVRRLTGCRDVVLLIAERDSGRLVVERGTATSAETEQWLQRRKQGCGLAGEAIGALSELLATHCAGREKSIMLRDPETGDAENASGDTGARTYADEIAVPIRSAARKAVGVLWCHALGSNSDGKSSFCPTDLLAAEAFASAIGPFVEGFLRIRNESILMRVGKDLAPRLAHTFSLKDLLSRVIETVVSVLNADTGSIYLADPETGRLTCQAGAGTSKALVGKGTYEIGEGLTGRVADRKEILNLRSRAEVVAYGYGTGKHDSIIWPTGEHQCETLCAMPIVSSAGELLGIWKVANVRRSELHPDPYFTEEDVQVGQVLSAMLAYAIEDDRHRAMTAQWGAFVAERTLQIFSAATEDDAKVTALETLESLEFKAMLSMYDSAQNAIRGEVATDPDWSKVVPITIRPLDGADVLAIALRENKPQFVEDAQTDPRCDHEAARVGNVHAFYALPLRMKDELIGTLQVDMGRKRRIEEETVVMLHAFAAALALAISRLRAAARSAEMTTDIMAESRFLVAEALSAVIVHHLGHKRDDVLAKINAQLEKREIRENRLLKENLKSWQKEFSSIEPDLRNALEFVRTKRPDDRLERIDLHAEIQKTLDVWYTFIMSNKCRVQCRLEADRPFSRIVPEAFRQIIAVLIANSVQAHARNITVRTRNDDKVELSQKHICQHAMCVEVADDGIGLATNDTSEIFKSTYTTKSEKYGTGLGLFIAQRLAKRANGEIRVEGEGLRSKGVTFQLVLPAET